MMRGDYFALLIVVCLVVCWLLDWLILSDKRWRLREEKTFQDGQLFVTDAIKRGVTEAQLLKMITPGFHAFDRGMIHKLRELEKSRFRDRYCGND